MITAALEAMLTKPDYSLIIFQTVLDTHLTPMRLSSSITMSTPHTTSLAVQSSVPWVESLLPRALLLGPLLLAVGTTMSAWPSSVDLVKAVKLLLQEFNALGVVLENRYYGASYPFNTSTTDNLRFFTTEQGRTCL